MDLVDDLILNLVNFAMNNLLTSILDTNEIKRAIFNLN